LILLYLTPQGNFPLPSVSAPAFALYRRPVFSVNGLFLGGHAAPA